MRERNWKTSSLKGLLVLLFGAVCLPAHAVPSFARQTGQPCQACHTVAPELTAFGRAFKLNGFTLTTLTQVKSDSGIPLSLNRMPPFAAEVDVADTFTRKSQDSTQNGNLQLPSKFKIFIAGGLAPNVGAFSYFEYTQPDDHFHIDLTDIRIVGQSSAFGTDAVYGLTLNNAPTLEDPWNTLNVWSFPHEHSDVAPTPAASTLLGGALADSGKVAGAGAYSLWGNHLYAAVTAYRSSPNAAARPLARSGAVEGLAPYARLAWQTQLGANYLEVGVSSLMAKFIEGASGGASATGLSDRYRDYSADAQFELPFSSDYQVTLHSAYIRERQTLDASLARSVSTNARDSLNTWRADGMFLDRHGYALTVGAFGTTGTADAGLYSPAAVTGSANGKPDSSGWIGQAAYLPYENIQFKVQYTLYDRFNGGRSNYDGSGRNAGDNNTLFVLLMSDW